MSETNRVVVRYLDGRVLKGTTEDFFPNRPTFHLYQAGAAAAQEIDCRDLKAVFFVRDFAGNPRREDMPGFGPGPGEANQGKRIAVLFKDGELLCGYTLSYTQGRSGFFLMPADSRVNNLRVYVLSHATQEIKAGAAADAMAQRLLKPKAA